MSVSAGAVDDPRRLAAVRRSALVDTEPEFVFDELTRAAARLLDTPLAFMTAVDADRSFWKSAVGVTDGTRANDVDDSFCQYVIEGQRELLVGDAATNQVTRRNPSITSMGVRAWAGCPVILDDEIIGTFCVVDQRNRVWSEQDRDILRHLAMVASREVAQRATAAVAARQTSDAVVRADLAEELLGALRASLLPPEAPRPPGVDLATWYEAAHAGDLLLGDFYDVFPIDRDDWAVVVGDVCGHGVQAARLTAMIRYSLRSALVHHDDLADAVTELDRLVRADPLDDGRFATLCCFRIKPDADGLRVQYVRAGHPYPIVVSSSGASRLLESAGGPPVGLSHALTAQWHTETIRLGAHERILAYTDGATECLTLDGTELGEAGLLAAVESAGGHATSDEILDAVRERLPPADPRRTDDTLLVAFGPAAGSHEQD